MPWRARGRIVASISRVTLDARAVDMDDLERRSVSAAEREHLLEPGNASTDVQCNGAWRRPATPNTVSSSSLARGRRVDEAGTHGDGSLVEAHARCGARSRRSRPATRPDALQGPSAAAAGIVEDGHSHRDVADADAVVDEPSPVTLAYHASTSPAPSLQLERRRHTVGGPQLVDVEASGCARASQ